MAGSSGDGQREDFCWDALVAQVLHPARVGIIEALRWIDQPLSAADLQRISGRERVEHDVRRLAGLDVVSVQDDTEPGSPAAIRLYRLVGQPSP